MSWQQHFVAAQEKQREQGTLRQLNSFEHHDTQLRRHGQQWCNLASNDYLGLASDHSLKQQFYAQLNEVDSALSASSSRLLTGSFSTHAALEQTLATVFGREAALVFGSGYHMNLGILSAITDKQTLVLADKLVHASMIDGLRLSPAKLLRYKHNDLQHLEQLLEAHHNDYARVLIVTESIFSMDGDLADLPALVQLKQRYPHVALYVDEAHAVGVRGETGLGCAEEQQCVQEIDFLVGTFGKALHSVGGYVLCSQVVRDFLINHMRPFIFSTALPPLNMAWTHFVLQRMASLQDRRDRLNHLTVRLRERVAQQYDQHLSASHIVPVVLGSNEAALDKARQLQEQGLWVMAVRPPTVPVNQARLRISLTADVPDADFERLLACL
ncbi:8-amino-7-oxononanoate synthase [Alcaligenaceae bacterium 429]|nr:8-amino-7-oxononanoate synthase [Alcaligenaceae bacterium 429]